MPINLNQGPIDPTQPQFRSMLENLQGHVLKHHGRNHTRQLLLRFHADVATSRAWVKDFSTRYVVSSMRQLREVERFKQTGAPAGLFGVLYLSALGYRALGIEEDRLAQAHADNPEFLNGLESLSANLNDDPSMWEAAYRGRQIHAMVVLADEDEGALEEATRLLCPTLDGVAHVLAIEKGRAMRNGAGEGIEHFGYVDGRSQPLFLDAEVAKEKAEGGIDQWDPSAQLSLMLVPDRLSDVEDSFGSYLVLRKLEQNVRGFKAREEELADLLGLEGDEARERAGALVVGRFEDGTPVTRHALANGQAPVANNFNYDKDSSAMRCPFQGHIRKTNPRGDSVRLGATLEQERGHRIIRRGITYGVRNPLPTEEPSLEQMPTAGVGLLFQSLQSSVSNQFVFMQRAWVNNENFVEGGTGIDPIVGQVAPSPDLGSPGSLTGQNWGTNWNQAGTLDLDFSRFVTMRGGEIFFLPSLPFLLSL